MKYQFVNLLCDCPLTKDIDQIANYVYQTCKISSYQKRESSNYVEGFYFTGIAGTRTIDIQLSDSDAHDDLPIWIDFMDEITHDELVADVDKIVRNHLLPAGFKVARMENFGRMNEKRIDYSLNAPE